MRGAAWCLYNDGSWSDDPVKDTIRRQLPDGSLADDVWVTVTFSDGSSVTRHRTPKTNEYTLKHADGTVTEIPNRSVGTGFLSDVGDFTGFRQTVWPNEDKCYLNFSNDANDGRFLLADTNTAVDTKLGAVMGTDVLERAVKKAATLATSASRASTKIEQDIAAKRTELTTYSGLEAARAAYDVAVKLQETATQADASWQKCLSTMNALSVCTNSLTAIGDGPERLGVLLDRANASLTTAAEAERKVLTALGLAAKLESMVGPTEEQVDRFTQATEAAAEAERAHSVAFLTFGAAVKIARALKDFEAQVEVNERDTIAIDAELQETLAAIDVCPIDGQPHQLCPFWRQEQDEQTV